MLTGLVISFYYSSQDLPNISERYFMPQNVLKQLPVFFGIVIYTYEGIALVLPLQNAMKEPKDFGKGLGVLNVGMTVVCCIFASLGGIGYWKYGDDTESSITLNLPTDQM